MQFVSSLEVLWYRLMVFFLAFIRVGKFPLALVLGNLVAYFRIICTVCDQHPRLPVVMDPRGLIGSASGQGSQGNFLAYSWACRLLLSVVIAAITSTGSQSGTKHQTSSCRHHFLQLPESSIKDKPWWFFLWVAGPLSPLDSHWLPGFAQRRHWGIKTLQARHLAVFPFPEHRHIASGMGLGWHILIKGWRNNFVLWL